jgi:uncharacterized protein (DUF2267 family)
MQYDEFIRQVQQRARLSGRGEAIAATRATLETLAERLPATVVEDLAAQLPPGISTFLVDEDLENGQRFDMDEFFERVADRADADEDEVVVHARAVVEAMADTISQRTLERVLDQLPTQYERLFAVTAVGHSRRGGFASYDADDYEEEK